MRTEKFLITPDIAREMLKANTSNRVVRKAAVNRYANDMKNGEWTLHHQGIAFSPDGQLVDGQHRLLAIIQSDIAVNMLVTYGVLKSATKGIDENVKRDLGDSYGLRKTVSPVIAFAASVFYSGRPVVSRKTTEQIVLVIVDEVNELMDFCGTTSTYFSSRPFKLGAVISMILYPTNKKEIMELYRNFVTGRLAEIPVVGQHLYSQVARKVVSAGSIYNYQTFARSIDVFNPNNWDHRTRMVVSERSIDAAIKLLRDTLLLLGVDDPVRIS